VQETEYTGAGKHIQPQLSFARENGIEILFGDPQEEVQGKNIILPSHPSQIKAVDSDMNKLRASYIKNCIHNNNATEVTNDEVKFMMEDCKASREFVENTLKELGVKIK